MRGRLASWSTLSLFALLGLVGPVAPLAGQDHPAVEHLLSNEWVAEARYTRGGYTTRSTFRMEFVGRREIRVHLLEFSSTGPGGRVQGFERYIEIMNPVHQRIVELRPLSEDVLYMEARLAKGWKRRVAEAMLAEVGQGLSPRTRARYRRQMEEQLSRTSPLMRSLIRLEGDSALALGVKHEARDRARVTGWEDALASPNWRGPMVMHAGAKFAGAPRAPETPTGGTIEPSRPAEAYAEGTTVLSATVHVERGSAPDEIAMKLSGPQEITESIPPRVPMEYPGYPPGTYRASLAGLGDGCRLDRITSPDGAEHGRAARIALRRGMASEIDFHVACAPTETEAGPAETGELGVVTLDVRTEATKPELSDRDGYEIALRSRVDPSVTKTRRMGRHGGGTIDSLPVGPVELTVDDLAPGCALDGPPRRTVTSRPESEHPPAVPVAVICRGVTLNLAVEHAGAAWDRFGTLWLDEGEILKAVPDEGEAVSFEHLAPGTHELAFKRLDPSCRPDGGSDVVTLDLSGERDTYERRLTVRCMRIATTFPDILPLDETYRQRLDAEHAASGRVLWSLAESALPPGLFDRFERPPAELFGTPSEPGDYTFTLRATDQEGRRAEREVSLTVLPRLTFEAESPGLAFGALSSGDTLRSGDALYLEPGRSLTAEVEATDYSYYLRRVVVGGEDRSPWPERATPRATIEVEPNTSNEISVDVERCEDWRDPADPSKRSTVSFMWTGTFLGDECVHPGHRKPHYHPLSIPNGPQPHLVVEGTNFTPVVNLRGPETRRNVVPNMSGGPNQRVVSVDRLPRDPSGLRALIIDQSSEEPGPHRYRAYFTRCGGPLEPEGTTRIRLSAATSCDIEGSNLSMYDIGGVPLAPFAYFQARTFALDESWGGAFNVRKDINVRLDGVSGYRGVPMRICLHRLVGGDLERLGCDGDSHTGLNLTALHVQADLGGEDEAAGTYVLEVFTTGGGAVVDITVERE